MELIDIELLDVRQSTAGVVYTAISAFCTPAAVKSAPGSAEENGIVCAGRSPDKIETRQALVAKTCNLVGLSEWRYAANGEPGDVADVPWVGAFQGFADQCRCLGGVSSWRLPETRNR